MTSPKKGDVWNYNYLWRRENEAGAEEGRKPRPTALVAIAVGKDGRTNLSCCLSRQRSPGLTGLQWKSPKSSESARDLPLI